MTPVTHTRCDCTAFIPWLCIIPFPENIFFFDTVRNLNEPLPAGEGLLEYLLISIPNTKFTVVQNSDCAFPDRSDSVLATAQWTIRRRRNGCGIDDGWLYFWWTRFLLKAAGAHETTDFPQKSVDEQSNTYKAKKAESARAGDKSKIRPKL